MSHESHSVSPTSRQGFPLLARIGSMLRTLLLTERLSWIIAAVIVALAALIITDYLLVLPLWARLIWLAIGTGLMLWSLWRWLRPVMRFTPAPEQLALLVEQTSIARSAGLQDALASGVGLQGTGQAQGSVRRAEAALGSLRIWQVLSPRRALIALACMVALLTGGLTLLAARPTMTLIGLQRALLPWSSAQWPKRQDLRDITNTRIHPLGQALALRAALVRGGGDPERTDVTVRYRLIDGQGVAQPWREVGAAYQGKAIEVPPRDELDTFREPRGPLFERLVEPTGLIADPTAPDRPARLEYRFASTDDRTDSRVIDLVPPPSIQRAEATIAPPRYASHLPTRTLDLGPGSDERATVPGVLPGSAVQLRLAFNKPVAATAAAVRTPEQLTALLGADVAAVLTASPSLSPAPSFVSEDGGAAWLIGWTHRSTVRLLPRPTDTQGLTVVGEPAYRIELREDKPPESIITQPAQDTDALATAKLNITGQSRDDVGLASAALRWQIAARPNASAGAPAQPSGEPTELTRQAIDDPSTLTAELSSPLDLPSLNVRVGQEVWLTVLAQDRFELDGTARAPVASPVRVIRIISPEQLLEQLWAELAGVQRAAQRLSEQQQALADRLKGMDARTPSGAQAEVARRQAEISEQLTRAGETVARAGQRQRDNGLEDAELNEVLRQARELAEQARGASGRAAQAAQQAEAASQSDRPAEATARREDAASAQREALDRLDQLAETLDRGQDTWAARRGIERLLREQAALREATSAVAPETLGKRPEELTAQQRAALQDLADRQEQLGRRADEAFRNLDQRAEQLQQRDAGASQSLRDAARQGRQSGASDQMQQAARSVQRNAQQQAQQAQQRAEQALQNVLNQLRDQARSRDAVLRRQLASLLEAIDDLITRQRAVLTDLTGAADDAARAALDAPQIRINTSTLSTAQQAREAGREARTVARLLEEAAAAQTEAITALRRRPAADAPKAQAAMGTALTKLEEARTESQRQQQQAGQREQARQREQIRRQYEVLLVEATALRVDSADLVGVDLDRRTRNRARGLADRHVAISTQLADMLAKTTELQNASMIALAHQRMDSANAAAADQLRAERVEPRLRISQMTVERVLRQLIEALTDQQSTPNEFRENEAGGGGGGGGGQQGGGQPLIPPVTELRLLRSMQDEALMLTREADATNDPALKAEAASVQAALAGRAEALLQAMQRQQQGGGGRPQQP